MSVAAAPAEKSLCITPPDQNGGQKQTVRRHSMRRGKSQQSQVFGRVGNHVFMDQASYAIVRSLCDADQENPDAGMPSSGSGETMARRSAEILSSMKRGICDSRAVPYRRNKVES